MFRLVFFFLFLIFFSIKADIFTYKNIPSSSNNVRLYTYGGPGFEHGTTIIENNGYIFSGNTIKSVTNSTDFILGKLDFNGNPLWAVTLGGTNKDVLFNTIQLQNKDLVMLGSSASLFHTFMRVMSPSREPRPFVVKLNEEGELKWALEFQTHNLRGMCESPNNGSLLVGSTVNKNDKSNKIYYEVLMTNLSNSGNVTWTKILSPDIERYVNANRVYLDSDQYTVLLELTKDNSFQQYGFGILTTDFEGNPKKTIAYLPKNYEQIFMRNSLKTSDNGRILVGDATKSLDKNSSDICVIKLDKIGTIVWAKVLEMGQYSQGVDIVELDGTYVLTAGIDSSPDGQLNNIYFLLNTIGNIQGYYNSANLNTNNVINGLIKHEKGIVGFGSVDKNKNTYDQDLLLQVITDLSGFKPMSKDMVFFEKELELEPFSLTFNPKEITYEGRHIKTVTPKAIKVKVL